MVKNVLNCLIAVKKVTKMSARQKHGEGQFKKWHGSRSNHNAKVARMMQVQRMMLRDRQTGKMTEKRQEREVWYRY